MSDGGYKTDIAYVRQFCSELNPALLRAAAALSGCPPPPAHDFEYAEIGCGFGETLAILAAAHPRARFTGADISGEHIAAARRLADDGALANVTFLERDFEDMGAGELPPLDYLCAHGLLTWISPAKRRAFFACVASRLKPGGLLYVGYNALPGWAAVEPLRRLLLDMAAASEGRREAAIHHALTSAKLLCESGAQYFVANPSAKELLETMIKLGVPYAAHEIFGAHWEPMYFLDMAEEASAVDLRFVGQVPLRLNYRDLMIAPGLKEQFRSISERRAWEGMKAFAVNEFFRRDVYVKGAVPRGDSTARDYVDHTPFGTLVPAGDVKREIALPSGAFSYEGPVFDAVIHALARRSSTVADLARDPSLAALGGDRVRQAVMELLMGNDALPMARSSSPAGASARRYHVRSAFNRALLAQALSRKHGVVLASPVAGTGVPVAMLHAVALRALTEAGPSERPAWLRALVDSSPLRLFDHGRAIVDKDELAQHLGEQIEQFSVARLPKLVELGVVEPQDD